MKEDKADLQRRMERLNRAPWISSSNTKTTRLHTQEDQVLTWNAAYPPGTRVRAYNRRKEPSELLAETVTIGTAEMLGGHTAVVWLQYQAGCFALDALEVLEE